MVLSATETGIGILSTSAMRAGETFILRLRPPAGAILCTVVHSLPFATGMYANGAHFTRPLPGRAEPAGDVPVFQNASDLAAQDLAHLRQVEDRLSQINFR